MDVLAMRRQGMSYVEIGTATGYHPATISKCDGGPPPARTVAVEDRVDDARWAVRLNELLVGNQYLLAKSLFEIISVEGFGGSYPTVARWVREQRGPRFRRADRASVPIETAPGEEAQFDFSDCTVADLEPRPRSADPRHSAAQVEMSEFARPRTSGGRPPVVSPKRR